MLPQPSVVQTASLTLDYRAATQADQVEVDVIGAFKIDIRFYISAAELCQEEEASPKYKLCALLYDASFLSWAGSANIVPTFSAATAVVKISIAKVQRATPACPICCLT
jgi:hypothetical protein